jgi:hypothetical protein
MRIVVELKRLIYKNALNIRSVLMLCLDLLMPRARRDRFDLIKGSKSQAGQESFVLSVTQKIPDKYYLEIGSGHPKNDSNTYQLEKQYQWRGVSIDFDKVLCEKFAKARNNPVYAKDATDINYEYLLSQEKAPIEISYLQIDVNPPEISYEVLQRIPFDKYSFAAITFEHDSYVAYKNLTIAQNARLFLKSRGYLLVGEDIKIFGWSFEDWWIHPKLVNAEEYKSFISVKRNGISLFSKKSQLLYIINFIASKFKNFSIYKLK